MIVLSLALLSTATLADVPGLMNYQGTLVDGDGVALDTTVSMAFSIYADSTGGSAKWTETQPAVTVSSGIFNVLLGSMNTIEDTVFNDPERWLGIQVGGDPELQPRQRIASAGYSFMSAESDTANYARSTSAASDGDWTIAGSDMYSNVPGFVGVGTSSPSFKLDIRGSHPDDGVVFGIGNSDLSHRLIIFGGRQNDPNPLIQWKDGDPLRFSTDQGGWSEKMRITSDGKVGIGTETPAAKLDVQGTLNVGLEDSVGYDVNFYNSTHDGGRFFWDEDKMALRVGRDSDGTHWSPGSVGYYSLATGVNTKASGNWSTAIGSHTTASGIYSTAIGGGATASGDMATVGGGYDNTASGDYATVSGGFNNTASADYVVVGGGNDNTVDAIYATVSGGYHNAARGDMATVGGGIRDTVRAVYGGVAAGYSNLAGDEAADTSALVGGGYDNLATAKCATVSGGRNNTASGSNSTVGGGWVNIASDIYATVSGGYQNTASDSNSTVGGGYNNTSSSSYATIGGGRNNTASTSYTIVGGGYDNAANGYMATVGGGNADTVKAHYGGVAAGYSNLAGDYFADSCAFVGGGYNNSATAKFATVGGGYNNSASYRGATVGGGYDNTANDSYTTVGGGFSNYSAGPYSFTVGYDSSVPSSRSNSAAFNGQLATSSGQTRVGNISKASGAFTIDHPTQPLNRILNHYFVESPEMVLIYRGVATIGPDGHTEVHLPDYFDALNRNPMVQLTGVGTSDVYVAEKVIGNRFVIGGKPNTEVYWTVTGDRKDPSAEITRILMPVEQLKEGDLSGHSLDDDYLASTMSQLERMGQAGKFSFRTQVGHEKYERSVRALERPEQMEPGRRD
jgi:hypothetical protein